MKRPSQDLSLTLLAYGLADAGDVAARDAVASYEVELERAGLVCYDPAQCAAVHQREAALRAIVFRAVQSPIAQYEKPPLAASSQTALSAPWMS